MTLFSADNPPHARPHRDATWLLASTGHHADGGNGGRGHLSRLPAEPRPRSRVRRESLLHVVWILDGDDPSFPNLSKPATFECCDSGDGDSDGSCLPLLGRSRWSFSMPAFVASPEQLLRMRADVLATIAYVVNIRFAIVGRSYVDGNVNPTPVLTFWSLSLEEQFYFVLPLIPVIAFMGTRRYRRPSRLETIGHVDGLSDVDHFPATAPRRPARTVLAVSAALCVACTVWMAYLFHAAHRSNACITRQRGDLPSVSPASRWLLTASTQGGFHAVCLVTWCTILTPVILASFVWLWITVEDAANDATYQGGFLVDHAHDVIVLVACTTVGPISRILGWRPLFNHRAVLVWHVRVPLADHARLLATSSLALRGWQLILATIAITAIVLGFELPPHRIPDSIRKAHRSGPRSNCSASPPRSAWLVPPRGHIRSTRRTTQFRPDRGPRARNRQQAKETVMVVGDSLSSNLAHGLFATKPDGVAILDRTTPGSG